MLKKNVRINMKIPHQIWMAVHNRYDYVLLISSGIFVSGKSTHIYASNQDALWDIMHKWSIVNQ